MENRAYLVAFRTILPPAGGSRDVGFLGCGVDALVAEIDHAVACLSDLAKLSQTSIQRNACTFWIVECSTEGLNWNLVRLDAESWEGYRAFTSNITMCIIAMIAVVSVRFRGREVVDFWTEELD